MKRIIASLLAGLCLLALVGCSAGSKADSAAPKDYSQIIHDARTDEGVDTQAEEQPADSTEAQADESTASPAA